MNIQSEPESKKLMGGAAIAVLADRLVEAERKLVATARANAAFGEPRTLGQRTIIPVAEVMCGFGFGLGSRQEASLGAMPPAEGRGGGFGGGARSRPMAVIVIEPERIHVRPIVNLTKISLAALAASVVYLFLLRRLFRR